jgi:acetylornithine deacetylase
MSDMDEIKNKVFNKINKEEVIEFLKKSIKTQSITTNEKKYGEMLFKKMQEIGFDKLEKFEFKSGRPDIYGIIGGNKKGRDLMFVSHIDTVAVTGWKEHWMDTDREDPFSGVLLNDEIWGRGAGDMKAGVIAPLFAIKAIKDSNLKIKGKLINILVGDEEAGIPNSGYSDGIKAIVEKIKKGEIPKADFAIYTEPTSLDVYIAQIGYLIAEITVKGRSAYYGTPWLGEDAIRSAYKLMNILFEYSNQIWEKKSHSLLGRPFNLITEIKGGGYIAVPEECKISIIRKILPGESVDKAGEEIENILKLAAINHNIKTEVKFTVPKDHKYGGRPAEISESLESVSILKNSVEQITGKKEIIKGAPYWSEISFLILDLGIPSVYCAAGDITNCHTYYERVGVTELVNSIKVFINMIIEFCGVD